MTKITATTTILHGHDRYEEGDHDVPLALAAYFVGNGWATTDDPEIAGVVIDTPTPDVVDLEVDDLTHETGVTDSTG